MKKKNLNFHSLVSIHSRTWCIILAFQLFIIKRLDSQSSTIDVELLFSTTSTNNQTESSCQTRSLRFPSRLNLLPSRKFISSIEDDLPLTISNPKQVYWMVTEHDFIYCTEECATLKPYEEIESSTRRDRTYVKLSSNIKSAFEIDSAKMFSVQKWESSVKRIRKNSTRIDCRPFAKKTDYDFLTGISNRERLKSLPEPELIHMFDKTGQLRIGEIRQELLNIENKQGVNVFNRLGNFNRLIGDSYNAIECFRKALYLEPRNSYLLINLARLLFKLKHYEDAVYLTKRSIEFAQASRSSWFQHFTLAEIYHALGYDNQALAHVRLALKLKPGHANAMKLATELASKSFIQSSRFSYMFGVFEKLFYLLTSTAPSFYFQLFFHLFILVFLILFGLIYSLLSIICDVRFTTSNTKMMIAYNSNHVRGFVKSRSYEYGSTSSSSLSPLPLSATSQNHDKDGKQFSPLSMRIKKVNDKCRL